MKKIIGILFLTGCSSLVFDPIEFDRYVGLTLESENLIKECSNPNRIRGKISNLEQTASKIQKYASLRGNREEIRTSVDMLYSLVSEMNTRYSDGTPSEVYCKEKLSIISKTSETISKTLGRL